MSNNSLLNVALFAGGRGGTTLLEVLRNHRDVNLSVIVNAYDDGLSTGAIRRFLPGMLGPSDIRKNIATLIPDSSEGERSLKAAIEYRLPAGLDFDGGKRLLEGLCNSECGEKDLDNIFGGLSVRHSRMIVKYVDIFLEYCLQRSNEGVYFDFSDCALGNILIAGSFLNEGRDFNRCVKALSEACGISSRVVNVTDGRNLVLMGLKEDGQFLKNEAEIVSKQNETKICDIFLLKDYLSESDSLKIASLSLDQAIVFLKEKSIIPNNNPEVLDIIKEADVIIYGPGTQHSSLLPSYMTRGVGSAIEGNTRAEKIFISNILKDHEIQSETANSLVRKLEFYLTCKGQWKADPSRLINRFFFQTNQNSPNSCDYVSFDKNDFDFPLEKVVLGNWESVPGKHSGGRVFEEIISIVNTRLQRKIKTFHHQVSIIVPGLNEERTVAKVLHELMLLDFHSLGIGKEIIFVDGGSFDKTLEIAKKFQDIKVFSLEGKFGRGAALRLGFDKANGNVIAFFPCDNEYNVGDLKKVVETLVKSEFKVVFGSRAIKCVDLSRQVKEIYPNNALGYLISKYGGMLFSILCLLLYNRYVSDVLTGIKAFDSRLLKSLNLTCNGVDLDLEIIAKLGRRRTFIFEIPVDYKARRKHEGKKTTTLDGFKGIWALFRFRLRDSSHAKAIHRYPGLQ